MAQFATVTISSSALSPSTKTILCSNVTVGFKRDTEMKPLANPGTLAKVQTQSQENPTYSIRGVNLTGASGTLTYSDLLTLAKINFDGTNAPTLTVKYGTATTLVGYDGSTTAIPVILRDFTVNIDTKETLNGYIPQTTINFVETKTS